MLLADACHGPGPQLLERKVLCLQFVGVPNLTNTRTPHWLRINLRGCIVPMNNSCLAPQAGRRYAQHSTSSHVAPPFQHGQSRPDMCLPIDIARTVGSAQLPCPAHVPQQGWTWECAPGEGPKSNNQLHPNRSNEPSAATRHSQATIRSHASLSSHGQLCAQLVQLVQPTGVPWQGVHTHIKGCHTIWSASVAFVRSSVLHLSAQAASLRCFRAQHSFFRPTGLPERKRHTHDAPALIVALQS